MVGLVFVYVCVFVGVCVLCVFVRFRVRFASVCLFGGCLRVCYVECAFVCVCV